jgi:palmitoyltransferase
MLVTLAIRLLGSYGAVIVLAFYSIILAIFVHCFFFADTSSSGINGKVSRYLYDVLPEAFAKTLKAMFGQSGFDKIYSCYHYVTNERNPIMQLVYLVTLNGCFIGWLTYGEPLLPVHYIGIEHKYIAYVGICLCHYSFYIACKASPGIISKENFRCFMHRPYDNLLFLDGYGCSTCLVRKVTFVLVLFGGSGFLWYITLLVTAIASAVVTATDSYHCLPPCVFT